MRLVARYCPPVCGLLTLALTLASPVRTARAQEPAPATDPDPRARLEAIYSAANQAIQAGDHAAAADRYAEAVALLPESLATHESRALALIDSVNARREAHARGQERGQLCLARDLLRAYLLDTRKVYGASAGELDGPRQAGRLHGEIEVQLLQLDGPGEPAATCPRDQPAPAAAAPSPSPSPAAAPPPRRDPRVIGGYTLLGVAGGSLVLMSLGLGLGAAAEKRGQDAHMADPAPDVDALLADGFYQRGRAANRLAVVGGVLAGVAAVTGAALLIRARVRPRDAGGRSASARRAELALTTRGLGLRF
ncbi:MAG: hypothetical protein JNL82_02010 [Myxococcales bacterium]|nr:hypothetical protein [Myxococcales bacterium]